MSLSLAKKLAQLEEAIETRATFAHDLAVALAVQVVQSTNVTFPSPKYRADPVAFFREVLGVEPWSKQIEVINAIRDHKRVSIKSGHKVSKSNTFAGIALWFYCSFEDARVVMTSTTDRQVNGILWLEVRKMHARSGLCVDCKRANEDLPDDEKIIRPCEHSALIGGKLGMRAGTGLTSEDFREIKGYTASEAEAVAGTSGKNLLYLCDEASGIAAEIFEAIEGNRAGGARVCYASNPTKTSGEFYDSHNSKSDFFECITISSEDTPNVRFGDDSDEAIPGLASREWVEEKVREWGRESPQFKVRVSGEFAELEDGKIFSVHMIAEAEERARELRGQGRLYIGMDVAGESQRADEWAWAPRRGLKVYDIETARMITKEASLMRTLGLIGRLKQPREIPVVVMDREGKEGSEAYGAYVAFLATQPDPPFELVGVRASDGARRYPTIYDRMRDELAGVFFDFLRDGGGIPEDAKLAAELHALEWISKTDGRQKITPKKVIKKLLGRSPDRYDAVVLSTWESAAVKHGKPPRRDTVDRYDDSNHVTPYTPRIDPYAGRGR